MEPTPPIAVQSSVEGMVWPALPSGSAQSIHSVLLQLEHTQWLPPAEIEWRQLAQLRRLLRHAWEHVPFYRERLSPIVKQLEREPLTPALFDTIPILTRRDIQENGEALKSTAMPKSHGAVSEVHTSGSTGKPISVLHSAVFRVMWRAYAMRDHFWHRRNLSGKLASIRGRYGDARYPEGQRGNNWGTPRRAGIATGPLITLDINCTTEQQVEWLQRNDPDYLTTYPTNVVQLARHCLDKGIALPKLKQVMTIAEIVTPEARRLAREAWGAKLSDSYTSRDIGYMAIQCPEHETYHIQSESCRVEVLDESGKPCRPGEIGQVVATPINDFAMPLIRYAMGDHAEVGKLCSCGRGLPVLNRIVGRTQQLIALPDGGQRWAMFNDRKLHGLRAFGVDQFQFVQRSLTLLEARFVLGRAMSPEDEAGVRAWIAENFDPGFEVDLKVLDEIPRTADGKFLEFMSEVGR